MFFFQAEDGIRDLVRSRGLGDVYKRQVTVTVSDGKGGQVTANGSLTVLAPVTQITGTAKSVSYTHLTLPTSDLV